MVEINTSRHIPFSQNPCYILAMGIYKPMTDRELVEAASVGSAEIVIFPGAESEQSGAKATEFFDSATGARKKVFIPEEKKKRPSYTWGKRYFQCSFDLVDMLLELNLPKETERVLKRLITMLSYGEMDVTIPSYREIGVALGPVAVSPQHVYRSLVELERQNLLKRQPGGRRVFLNPEMFFRGSGEDQRKAVEEWQRWTQAAKRKQKRTFIARRKTS